MAGHSKFKNIMHRKGRQDQIRGKVFAKRAREIIVATKLGGPDPSFNPRLRLAIAAAKSDNMPNDKINGAIKRGSGAGEGENYEEIRYEGYGTGGVAVIVECLTDNRNRTAAEVRTAFNKHGGNMGETGSVSFMFDRVGMIQYSKEKGSEEEMFEAALEAGADNCEDTDDWYDIACDAENFGEVREALEQKFGEPSASGLVWLPKNTTALDEDKSKTLEKMLEVLEDSDDVQRVFTNQE